MTDPANLVNTARAKVPQMVCALLTCLPLVFLVGLIIRYCVPVPFMDQWELVPMLDRLYQGNLTFHDLWAQHNEHRIFFPRLIMLGLARLTGWDIRYELAVNLVLAVAVFAVLASQIRRTARELNLPALHWTIPACSLVVFSASQFQNWLWGWQIQMLLNLLAAVAGLLLLAIRPFNWMRFGGAALLGIVATYSFANGVLFWPAGLLMLLPVTARRRDRSLSLSVWVLLSILTLWFFFRHYEKPAAHSSLLVIFRDPMEYVSYVFYYLGAAGAEYRAGQHTGIVGLALLCGYGAAAALGWAIWRIKRAGLADRHELLPYLGISSYSIGSALMTGIGRVGLGSDQALSSRYCTMTVPFWVSLIVILFVVAQGRNKAANDRVPGTPPGELSGNLPLKTARWLLGGAIVLLTLGSILAVQPMKAMSERQARGQALLLQIAANPGARMNYRDLLALYPTIQVVLDRYPMLVKHRLSIFKEAKPGADGN